MGVTSPFASTTELMAVASCMMERLLLLRVLAIMKKRPHAM